MSLRERNLARARDLVRDAAVEAFVERGYVATTMTDVARRAGVARQTVYNLFDSKAALLIDALGARATDARNRDQSADRSRVLDTQEPEALVRRFAAAHRLVVERTAPIVRVAQQASAVDPAVADHLAELERGRAVQLGAVVDVLSSRGALRTDRPVDELRRGFVALTSPAVAVAVLDGGVEGEAFEAWVAATVTGLLLP